MLFVASLAPSGAASTQRPLIGSSQNHRLVDVNDCARFYTQTTGSLPAKVRTEEHRSLVLPGVDLLKVRPGEDGGVSIRGWDRPVTQLTICKCAMGASKEQAQRTLDGVQVSTANGEIVASGPDKNETQVWWVHMILRVPRAKNLDVTSENGGIAIRNMKGTINARAINGGISLASCAGQNKVETENGGIVLEKISGPIEAVTQNGPIALKVAMNPIPPIEAQTDESAIMCTLKGCDDGLGNWTPNRKRLRIGTAAPIIKLTTNTAPIMIEQAR